MKKWIAAALCAALTAMLLSGCGTQTETSASPSPEASQSAEPANAAAGQINSDEIRGIVTAVDGDAVTVRTMGMGGGPMGDGPAPDGQASAPPDGQNAQPSAPDESGSPVPDGPQGGENGGAPRGGGAPQGGGLEQTGEEITVTVSADTKITIDSNGETSEGALADLATGSMIGITYGDDGETVAGITIYQAMGDRAPESR